MRPDVVVRLLLLGAIWGSSFLFMRLTVPAIGSGATAAGRLALGALVITLLVRAMGRRLEWRARWRDYLIVGLLASGLPFLLFAFAARHLPAGYSAVLNSTVPLFAVLLTWALTSARPSASKLLGVAVGVAGVATLARFGTLDPSPWVLAAFAACLGASLLYALAAMQLKRRFGSADPLVVAAGSMIAASLVLSPAVLLDPPSAPPSLGPALALLTLGVLCTGVANAIYFGLVRDAGPERATTVTFLMPVFAQVWGALFIDEPLTMAALGGCALVLSAVALVFEKVPGPARLRAALEQAGALFAPRGLEPIAAPTPCCAADAQAGRVNAPLR
jgi:drug/metabolite transporter (DMT)-like permease